MDTTTISRILWPKPQNFSVYVISWLGKMLEILPNFWFVSFFLLELLFCMKQHHFPFVAVEMHLFLISENKTYIYTQLDWTSRNFQKNFEFGFDFFLLCLWIENSTMTKLQLDIESHGGIDRKLQLTTLAKLKEDAKFVPIYCQYYNHHALVCCQCQYLGRYFACPLNFKNSLKLWPTVCHEFEAVFGCFKIFFLFKYSKIDIFKGRFVHQTST